MLRFIRVLYGENFEETRPKILKDLKRSFRHNPTFCKEEVTYYTMGEEATRLLKEYGAEDVRMAHSEPLIRVMGGTGSWNKVWLMMVALADHDDGILYTDMDTFPRDGACREEITSLLMSKKGLNRMLQMTLISYHKNYYSFRPKSSPDQSGWSRVSPKLGMFGCFIHLNSTEMVNHFMEDADELEATTKIRPVSDERFITYSLDKRFGVQTVGDLWTNFVPDTQLINPRCSLCKDLISKNPDPIFRHVR